MKELAVPAPLNPGQGLYSRPPVQHPHAPHMVICNSGWVAEFFFSALGAGSFVIELLSVSAFIARYPFRPEFCRRQIPPPLSMDPCSHQLLVGRDCGRVHLKTKNDTAHLAT
jgi:hypothetical protein